LASSAGRAVLGGISGDDDTSFGSDVTGALIGTNSGVNVPFVVEFGLTSEA